MILPDVSILIHAHNSDSPHHRRARAWWDTALSDTELVGVAWATLLGFIRITTNRSILENPWQVGEALDRIEAWLDQPNLRIVQPTDRHEAILAGFLRGIGTAGNLTTDAHLATLALEHGCTLCSTDTDFARFPGVRWRNPLTT